MDEKIIEILYELGLNREEVSVYTRLLELGSSLASVVSEKTRINRSLVYQILDKLIKKGFVSYTIRNNIRYYNPVSPDKLLELLKEREEKLKSALPKLKNLFKPQEKKPIVEILDGIEGIKTVLNDILNVKQDWYALGSGRSTQILPYFVEHWQNQRQKEKIFMRALLNQAVPAIKRSVELKKYKFTEVRFLAGNYDAPSSTWIYGNRVVVVMWSKDHPFAIRTISDEIAKSYRDYFNNLWKTSKR